MDVGPGANAFANTGSGPPWTDLDVAAVLQQVNRRMWTVLDILNLATDKTVPARGDRCGALRPFVVGAIAAARFPVLGALGAPVVRVRLPSRPMGWCRLVCIFGGVGASNVQVTVGRASVIADRFVRGVPVGGDVVQVVNESAPYVVAAASAYGAAVLEKAQQEAADATVGVGRRLALKIFGTRGKGEPVPEALADVIEDPVDLDNLAALRKAIRKALAADEELADQVAAMVGEAKAAGVHVTASGERSVAAHTISGLVVTGDDAIIER